jgi:hypothetical protein
MPSGDGDSDMPVHARAAACIAKRRIAMEFGVGKLSASRGRRDEIVHECLLFYRRLPLSLWFTTPIFMACELNAS